MSNLHFCLSRSLIFIEQNRTNFYKLSEMKLSLKLFNLMHWKIITCTSKARFYNTKTCLKQRQVYSVRVYVISPLKEFHETWLKCLAHWDTAQKPWYSHLGWRSSSHYSHLWRLFVILGDVNRSFGQCKEIEHTVCLCLLLFTCTYIVFKIMF